MQLLRKVASKDYEAIDIAYDSLQKNTKQWLHYIDVPKARIVCRGQHPTIASVVVAETYLLVFHVVVPWFSSDSFLEELMLLKIYKNGVGFKQVHRAIDYLCTSLKLSGAMTGTALSTNDEALARMYERDGFQKSLIGLFKETNENSK